MAEASTHWAAGQSSAYQSNLRSITRLGFAKGSFHTQIGTFCNSEIVKSSLHAIRKSNTSLPFLSIPFRHDYYYSIPASNFSMMRERGIYIQTHYKKTPCPMSASQSIRTDAIEISVIMSPNPKFRISDFMRSSQRPPSRASTPVH
jgi:hypothetical protein